MFGFSACKFEGYSQLVATYDYGHIGNWNRASRAEIIYEGGGSRVLVESPQVTNLQSYAYISILTAGNIDQYIFTYRRSKVVT